MCWEYTRALFRRRRIRPAHEATAVLLPLSFEVLCAQVLCTGCGVLHPHVLHAVQRSCNTAAAKHGVQCNAHAPAVLLQAQPAASRGCAGAECKGQRPCMQALGAACSLLLLIIYRLGRDQASLRRLVGCMRAPAAAADSQLKKLGGGREQGSQQACRLLLTAGGLLLLLVAGWLLGCLGGVEVKKAGLRLCTSCSCTTTCRDGRCP